ncbi:hypothetical protein JCM19047_1320 [Bacillus sp. JCM 19047]|nr:hypothetical protein JCM19047_1320 [Bacillus sp. JCM 19047]
MGVNHRRGRLTPTLCFCMCVRLLFLYTKSPYCFLQKLTAVTRSRREPADYRLALSSSTDSCQSWRFLYESYPIIQDSSYRMEEPSSIMFNGSSQFYFMRVSSKGALGLL